MVKGKKIWVNPSGGLDELGRVKAWVWMNCEAEPVFAKGGNPRENPKGCLNGELLNDAAFRSK